MTTIAEMESAYKEGYADGYDGALEAMMMFVELINEEQWSKRFLMNFLHVVKNAPEEQLVDLLLSPKKEEMH
jgi:flagellar biosynthesis/type III secretory pathway protein FliH